MHCDRGRLVTIAAPYDHQWALLCDRTGIERRREFATLDDRNAHADEVRAVVAAWAKPLTKSEVLATLGGLVPCAPVNDAEDIFNDPNVSARSMLSPIAHPGSSRQVTVAGNAIKCSATIRRRRGQLRRSVSTPTRCSAAWASAMTRFRDLRARSIIA